MLHIRLIVMITITITITMLRVKLEVPYDEISLFIIDS